ncbi:MAG: ATP-binding protein [Burkholderiaceae bacterium]
MRPGRVIGVVGVESTGKTTLARALASALDRPGRRAAYVPEFLREFCDGAGRTPRRDEQAGIAAEQTRRIDAAAAEHELVVADTTALMIAVYSDWVFGDASLYARAAQDHRRCALTLLTGLDIAWMPDGLQRDGPQVRAPIDALLRAALDAAGVAYSVVSGLGQARTAVALRAVEHAFGEAAPAPVPASPASPASPAALGGRPVWRHVCERCGDPACERRLLAAPPLR